MNGEIGLLMFAVVFLVLAAQFESWRDPLIILVSVPMSTPTSKRTKRAALKKKPT